MKREGLRAYRAARPADRPEIRQDPRPAARTARARARAMCGPPAIDPEADRPAHARCTRSTGAPDRSCSIRALPRDRPPRAPRHIRRAGVSMNPNPCSRRPRIGCCGCFVEQRVRSLERALRFAARAKHSGGGKTVKRSDRDLQRVALRPVRRLLEQRRRTFDDRSCTLRG